MKNLLGRCGVVIVFSIFISFLLIGNAQSRVIVKESEKFYSVQGKTGVQIFVNILKSGTKISKTGHAIASTKVKFDIKNIKGRASRRSCKVNNVDVVVSLLYTYPKWTGYKRANAGARKNWNKFMREVKRHERKHGKIAVDIAHKIERGFKRGRGRISNQCNDWATSVSRHVTPLIAKHQRRQAQFDKREHSRYSRVTRSLVALIKGK